MKKLKNSGFSFIEAVAAAAVIASMSSVIVFSTITISKRIIKSDEAGRKKHELTEDVFTLSGKLSSLDLPCYKRIDSELHNDEIILKTEDGRILSRLKVKNSISETPSVIYKKGVPSSLKVTFLSDGEDRSFMIPFAPAFPVEIVSE